MPLAPGTKLGPYAILSPIGAGGMGEVYRARDTRLGREVAVKVSHEKFSERFEREARLIASLNHPNVCTLHDVGPDYLVMELVEGPTLAERLAQGPVPVEEALAIARQIALALDAAHGYGIVHRDLKPGNIKLKPDGTVKVLDFGLAKLGGAAPAGAAEPATITIGATREGVILGTAAYMAPEQARGKEVDKRADIWAFGVVLYEMVTGRQAFPGDTVSDLLAAVLAREPDFAAAPAELRPLLRRCLEKDPVRRLRDIGDFDLALGQASVPAPPRSKLPWVVAAVVALAAIALGVWPRGSGVAESARLVIPIPANQELTDHPAISRDGRMVAYVTQEGSAEPRLFLRGIDAYDVREVTGSGGAARPFFSPDGRWVAFFAQGQLLKAAVAGGAPAKLADASFSFGGTWLDDDTIVYVPEESAGLMRIPAAGGKPECLAKPRPQNNEVAYVWPQVLPGGRSVLFTVRGKGARGTAVLPVATRQWELVIPGTVGAAFAPGAGSSGWVLAADETAGVKAARFDPAHPARTAADTPVLADAYYRAENMETWVSVARNGTAVYIPGSPAKRSLVWADRQGKVVETLSREPAAFWHIDLSPDGSKALVLIGADLWMYDFPTGARRRVTFFGDGGAYASSPIWSSDGKRIVFSSNESGDSDLYSQPSDGTRPPDLLLKRPGDQFANSLAADGTLVFGESYPDRGEDLLMLAPDGKVTSITASPFMEVNASVSPDGRWLAYQSDESGRFEIYVQPFPGGGKRLMVSGDGGIVPNWSRDGRELFYVAGNAVMAAGARGDGGFAAGRKLFDRTDYYFLWHTYDPASDGKRFLMIHRDAGSVPRQLNVILNWTAELERTLPAGK